MPNAHVISVEALLRFRQALVKFQEEGLGYMLGIDLQSQRLLQWLEGESPNYWRLEVLRCHELISRSRSALETAMMKKSRDYTPSCIEEKEQLKRSKHRLIQAEERREAVRRWARVAREEIDEYSGRVAPLRELLEQGIPNALARLDSTLRALERYFEATPPVAPSNSTRKAAELEGLNTQQAPLARSVTSQEVEGSDKQTVPRIMSDNESASAESETSSA